MYKELYPVTYYFYPLLEHSFQESPDATRFQLTLSEPKKSETENLLYIHIPFCHDLCRFCPFHVKVARHDEIYLKYTETLIKEMHMLARLPYVEGMTFKAVYFGGGSPSILNNELLRDIFKAMYQCFHILPEAEISFEGEPRTLGEPDKLDLLKQFNTSRISFGLQTYKPETRDLFNIVATLEDIDRVTRNARDRKFRDINVDMMYDLPGQTLSDLEYDLEHLATHDFDSIDYYNLHYYAFPKKMKVDMASGALPAKPSISMHFALAEHLMARMRELGYHHVADQIFAKEPQVCEYFRLLWGGGYGEHRAETLAVGASARGYLDGFSYMNYGSTNQYLKSVEEGELPFEKLSSRLNRPENRGAAFFPKFFRVHREFAQVMETIPGEIRQMWLENGLAFQHHGGWFLGHRGKSWTTNMMVDGFEPLQRELAQKSAETLEVRAGTRTGSF